MDDVNGTAVMIHTSFFIISVLNGTAWRDETTLVNIINVTNGITRLARRRLEWHSLEEYDRLLHRQRLLVWYSLDEWEGLGSDSNWLRLSTT